MRYCNIKQNNKNKVLATAKVKILTSGSLLAIRCHCSINGIEIGNIGELKVLVGRSYNQVDKTLLCALSNFFFFILLYYVCSYVT